MTTVSGTIRVLIADDQQMVRQGFTVLLDANPGIEVIGQAVDGLDAVRQVAELAPDVVLMDIRMPELGGIEATRRITTDTPHIKVLVLTTFDLDEYVYDALRAGASGFLLKDVTADRLVEAVRAVADGSLLLGPTVTRRLVEDFTTRTPVPTARKGLADLTPRELEILRAVARGLSNAEIGAELWIAEPTVKSHVSEALRKLGCRDRVQLVIAAYESGLV